jgi:hypothetical protein
MTLNLKRLLLLKALKAAFLNIAFDIHNLVDLIGSTPRTTTPETRGPEVNMTCP